MDVTIVRFANGSTLTFKHTDYDRGSVQVRLRFGARRRRACAPDRPSLAWLAGLVAPSGLANLDLDGMERLLTGRRMGLSFAIDETAFALAGQTNAADLPDQLRLLTLKLTHPRWDRTLLARFRGAAVESFDLHFSSASARAARELGGVLRPGDERWRPIEKAEMEAVTVERFRAFYAPYLAQGPVHAIIVGDAELEAGGRGDAPHRRRVAAPARAPDPADGAGASAARARCGAAHLHPSRRSQPGLCADRLVDRSAASRISATGARWRSPPTCSRPGCSTGCASRRAPPMRPTRPTSPPTPLPTWGVLYAAAEIRPASAATFFRIAREIIADLAARPALPDEFARAHNPVLSGIERRLATNAYWIERDRGLAPRSSCNRECPHLSCRLSGDDARGRAPRGRDLCDRCRRLVDAGASE